MEEVRNRVIIDYFCKPQPGARIYHQGIKERIRRWFYGKRYIYRVIFRCTSIYHAIDYVKNYEKNRIRKAEWIDGNGTSVELYRNSRPVANHLRINVIDKTIKM
jgi:hypothetical protein